MKKDIKNPAVSIQLTLKEVCGLMTEQTGKSVTPETHWIETSLEMVENTPPYALVKFHAFKR